MSTGQSINLIPQQEVQEQEQVKLVKAGTVLSIIALVIFGIISGIVFYLNNNLQNQITDFDTKIANLREQIKKQSLIEITARNLDTKYRTLKTVFDARSYYSLLMQEMKKRVPASIVINNFTLNSTKAGDPGTVSISGTADNYISIANFINDLTDTKFSDASADLEALFTGVTLNSVSLDTNSNKASFFINVSFDAKKLIKSL